MPLVGLVAGVVVGSALVVAGVLKLSDGPRWRKQSADMGVPPGLAHLVPLVEIPLGAALIGQVARPWPAVVAIALLAVFTILIVARILGGSRPPCACFGRGSTRPLGAYHVVRNLGLVTLAAVAAIWA